VRFYPLWAAAAAAIVAIAGCSSGGEGGPTSTAPTETTATSSETHTAAPGATEVSPGGVTTAIGADAESTEEEYSQACRAAKAWIDQQGGDRKAQIEPFLKTLQDPNTPPGPATYNTPWAGLSPARQAAVIVAVQAGADSLC
jgi:Putative lipoprotein LpqV